MTGIEATLFLDTIQRGLLRGSVLDLTRKRGAISLEEVDPPTWDLEVADDEPLSVPSRDRQTPLQLLHRVLRPVKQHLILRRPHGITRSFIHAFFDVGFVVGTMSALLAYILASPFVILRHLNEQKYKRAQKAMKDAFGSTRNWRIARILTALGGVTLTNVFGYIAVLLRRSHYRNWGDPAARFDDGVRRVRQVDSEDPDSLEGLVTEGIQGSVRLGSSNAEAIQQ